MFPDLSWSHMLLVLVVALVVVGPKDLPKLMRKLGQWTARARGMADQFRSSFDEMARQSELDELRKEIDELRNVRPLDDVKNTVEDALRLPDVSLSEAKTPAPEPLPEPPAEPPPEDAPPDIPAEPSPEPSQPHEGGITPPPP